MTFGLKVLFFKLKGGYFSYFCMKSVLMMYLLMCAHNKMLSENSEHKYEY